MKPLLLMVLNIFRFIYIYICDALESIEAKLCRAMSVCLLISDTHQGSGGGSGMGVNTGFFFFTGTPLKS